MVARGLYLAMQNGHSDIVKVILEALPSLAQKLTFQLPIL